MSQAVPLSGWIIALPCALLCVVGVAQQHAVRPAAPSTPAEQYLFSMANQERVQRGLPMLEWDVTLAQAAILHARQMAAHGNISHQYSGEPDLSEREAQAGAKFSRVAENVAEAVTAIIIHDAWMHSEGHRENLLDPSMDAVGIALVIRGGQLFAVEDFDRRVHAMSFPEQEHAVASLVASPNLKVIEGEADARKTCAMDTGYAGQQRPGFVMRFTSSDITQLPDALKTKLRTGHFRKVSIGACTTGDSGSFTSYSIAVLLYP